MRWQIPFTIGATYWLVEETPREVRLPCPVCAGKADVLARVDLQSMVNLASLRAGIVLGERVAVTVTPPAPERRGDC